MPNQNTMPLPLNMLSMPSVPKKVKWAQKVLQQKANSQQVKKYAKGACDSIMRHAAFAVDVANRHFTDGRSMPRGQRRNKAVPFAVQGDLFQDVAAIALNVVPKSWSNR